MIDVNSLIFMKRGVEYSLLNPSEKVPSLDHVTLIKHTPINSKRVHIFYASIRDMIDSSFFCPTCSGEYDALIGLASLLNEIFGEVTYNQNLFTIVQNNKTITIEYFGLNAMRNHRLRPEIQSRIESNTIEDSNYIAITYYDIIYHMDEVKVRLSIHGGSQL